MTKRQCVYVLVFVIQLGVLAFVVFFPEHIEEELFTDYRPVVKPVVPMEYRGEDPGPRQRKIVEADIFRRRSWTRGIGVEYPDIGILIIPDSAHSGEYHYDTLLVTAHEEGIGGIILDYLETPYFIPSEKPGGGYYTTDERRLLFGMEILTYMKHVGFKRLALFAFGSGKGLGVKLAQASGDVDFFVDFGGRENEDAGESSFASFPETLIFIGEDDEYFSRKTAFADLLDVAGVPCTRVLIPGAGYALLDENGRIDDDLERECVARALSWLK